jgi:GTP-binding protein
MPVPQVAIVGRPNVGKSSLFNWLVGRRLAIVDAVAGITRDRLVHVLEHEGRYFEIVDTGGIGVNDVDQLDSEITQQIQLAIDEANVLLMVVDIRDGLTEADRQIAVQLRSTQKPLLLVANKADHPGLDAEACEFYPLGLGDPIEVSTQNNRGKAELLRAVTAALPDVESGAANEAPVMKIAIVGRRNVGKSTFVNTLTQSNRMIVSDVAGTTRDSVDVRFELDGQVFVAIDTPGLRKRKSVRTDVEFYSLHRAQRSIRHADVVLMFFDAGSRISSVDQQLCGYIQSHFKPCLLVVNKWDLMSSHMPTEQWSEYLRNQFPGLAFAPIGFITATEGRNIKRLLNHAQMLFRQSRMRVATPDLNRLVRDTLHDQPPPAVGPRRGKVYFAVQVDVAPPTIVLKCNEPGAFPPAYRRFLLRTLHEALEFGEVPIRLLFEQRGEESPAADRSPTEPDTAQR